MDAVNERIAAGARSRNEEKKKGKAVEPSKHITLKVNAQDGNELYFKVKSTRSLSKLMKVYCERNHIDPNIIVFLFNGTRLRADQTPIELNMEDGDEIDAMLHQSGGIFSVM